MTIKKAKSKSKDVVEKPSSKEEKPALPQLVIRDRLYIPIRMVDMGQIRKLYDKYVYDNNQCRRCEFSADRHSYACDECQHFKGRFTSFTEDIKNGKKYLTLPRAELYNLKELGIRKFELVDKTSNGTPLNKKLKLTRKLYDYQAQCKDDLIRGDGRKHYLPHGILKAPPRSGKTLTSIAIAIELGGKFLILANQEDLLKQFIIELKQSTNIEDVDKFEGKQSFGMCSTVEDFERYDICLATYQTFLSPNGKKKLKKIRHMFRTVLIDECFTYGHKVMTDKGMQKIGDIVEGNIQVATVLSYNHETGKKEYKPLESVTKKRSTQLVKLTINGKQFICTPNHEFFVIGKGYIKAAELVEDDEVLLDKES